MNLLLITTDQQRFDFYDTRTVASLRTPHLQGLMARGTTFSHAYATCPVCMPARFTWLHGLYASQAHRSLVGNGHDWPEPGCHPTMTEALQRAGYRTALIGKLHTMAGLWHRDVVADEQHKTHARGFDDVIEVGGKSLAYWYDCAWTRHLESHGLLHAYRVDLRQRDERGHGWRGGERISMLPEAQMMDTFIGDQAVDWIERHAADQQPWFLHASLCGPHFPIDPLPAYLAHYDPAAMPPPEGLAADDPRVDGWRRRRAYYCAVIEHVDVQIGRLLQALERQGRLQDTLIFFTTDHGDMMGHKNRSNKGQPDDSSSRTPIVVAGPGVTAGIEIDATMVESCDLPLSILEAAGIDGSAALPGSLGRSFLACARGERETHRDWAYSEMGDWRMCRERDWKYVQRLDGADALYRMSEDPWELDNRIDDPAQAARVSAMRRQLVDHGMRSLPPDSRRHPMPRHDWFDSMLPADLPVPPEPWDR